MAVGLTSWLQLDESAPAPGLAGITSFLQIEGGADAPPAGLVGITSFLQIEGAPVPVAPVAVSDLDAFALTGLTYGASWTDNSDDETGFEVQIEVPALSGNWVAATGSPNPTSPNVEGFAGNGAAISTPYRLRVRPKGVAVDGSWTVSDIFTTDNPGGGGGELPPPDGVSAAIAFQEVGDDIVSIFGARMRFATLAFVEGPDDTVAVRATLRQTFSAAVAFQEAADDTVAVAATVRQAVQALVAFMESADDTVQVSGSIARAFLASLAFREEADDTVLVQGVVATSVGLPGTLAALSAEYVTLRTPSGLFIGYPEVLACAIMATRFYAGWAALADTTTLAGPFSITGQTQVTNDEWAVISPLFRLYCDRENAMVIEAAATAGLNPVGKSSSEVSSEILQAETDLPLKAYVEPAWSIGYPPAT